MKMDKPITKVLKSKSSNSAITMKINKRKNKTTKSNVDFQTSAVKKRGVYVENKDEKLDINVQVAAQSNKLPKKPRPGKKCFLTSVLTMLSKSTVGTQHPDVDYAKEIKNIGTRKNIKKTIYNRSETTKDRMSEKKKYKSRILNHKKDDKLVILQSTKEIVNTPSIDSEHSHAGVNNALKSNYLENYLRRVTSAEKLLAREVLEGEQYRKATIRFNNDPSTLVSDINHKDDKGLYNFFVDLLETTLSVCNLKADVNDVIADVSNPELDLEIRESVAEKLNIIDKYKLIEDENQKPLGQVHRIRNDQINWDDTELGKDFLGHPHKTFKGAPLNVQAKRRLKSSSFDYSKKSRIKPKRKANKASRKKSLLNSLKEQLRMESEEYVEPKNIFVALKQIAENKRRYEKSMQFQKQYRDGGNACRFKRRKVISTSNGSKRKEKFNPKSKILRSPRTIIPSMDSRNENAVAEVAMGFDSESHHSLEVYGFDDVTHTYKRQDHEEKISLTYHSSVSISDSDIDSNEVVLNYTFNGTNIINNFPSDSRDTHFLR